MNTKMKSCMTPHVMMHSLFGLGLGILLAALIPALSIVWLGIGIMIIAVILDAIRKK